MPFPIGPYTGGYNSRISQIDPGTGARTTQPGGPINGATLPSWEQVNLGITHRFETAAAGAIKLRFDVINLFDESYLLRSSTSLGAFAPAFSPRRTFFGGVTKEF